MKNREEALDSVRKVMKMTSAEVEAEIATIESAIRDHYDSIAMHEKDLVIYLIRREVESLYARR
jgi:hypothetical protein